MTPMAVLKDQRMKENWQEKQRNRRRVWINGTEIDFRNEINERLEDKEPPVEAKAWAFKVWLRPCKKN